MARRKASPNIPAETLARARAQAGVPDDSTTAADVPEAVHAEPVMDELILTETVVEAAPRRRSTSKRLQDAQLERTKKRGELDQATIKDLLIHPTKFPNAGDLRRDYTYVVKDLRNMFLLSAGLVAFLVALSVVLP